MKAPMSVVIAVLISVAGVVAAAAGALIVRRRVPIDVLRGHHDVAAAILGVMGTLYAVLLAFTVVIVWNHFNDAAAAIDSEANHAGALSRLAQGLDPIEERRVRASLSGYLNAVIRDEWPAMREGHDAAAAQKALTGLWSEYRAMSPAAGRQQTIYTESIKQLEAISDSRCLRLHSLNDDVPALMWIILITGGAMVVMFTYLFGPERVSVHVLMVTALATLICMSLFLVLALDNPFDGWPTLSSDVLQIELNRVSDGTER